MPEPKVAEKPVEKDVKDPQSNIRDPKEVHIENLNEALRQVRGELKAFEKKESDRNAKFLEEQGNFKKLYEDQKVKFEELQTKTSGYETFFATQLEQATAKVDKSVLALLPSNYSTPEKLEWITKATEVYGKNKTPAVPRANEFQGMRNPPGNDTRVTITKEDYMQMSHEERMKHLDDAVALRGHESLT